MAHFLRLKHPLLNEQGQLSEAGYSTSLVLDYDRRNIKANALCIKEWDSYLITDGKRGLALTVADHSYMGLSSISFLNFDEKWELTKNATTFMPMGKTNLPASSEYGDARICKKGYELRFENHGNNRVLTFRMEHFKGKEPISGKLRLACPKTDSMVIAAPFPGAPKSFFYNQKINCMPAEGTVNLGGQTYLFSRDDAMAVLDWGRSVLPYKSTRLWCSASGRIGGAPFGLNVGRGIGDPSAATENTLFWNGKAHKLDQVTIELPGKLMSPWRITDNEGRLELDFVPLLEQASRIGVQDQQRVFGRFSGKAVLDDGTPLIIKDLFGFAEKTTQRFH